MTLKEFIEELQELSKELPSGDRAEVCVELRTDSERYCPECYIDEDENIVVLGV